MDFVRLGPPYNTEFLPDKLIEGYNSLIWTERFQAFGEFQLKTYDIYEMLTALPEDTLVSHLDTRHVMMVETHSIEMVGEGADARPELTVRGRSAELILDHRFVEGTYGKKRRLRKKLGAVGAGITLIYNAIDNASGKDVTRGDDDPDTEFAVNDYDWTTKDKIPGIAITDSVTASQESRWWQLKEGMLYPQLMKILTDQDLSIRVLRPGSPNPATVATVQAFPIAERGVINRVYTEDVTSLRFDIYNGVDKSSSVKFSHLQGHLDQPAYLMSNLDFKTIVEMRAGEGVRIRDIARIPADGEENQADFTGWRRRVMDFDAGSPEIPEAPEKPKEPRANATPAQRAAYREDLDNWQDKYARWKNKRDRIVDDFTEEEIKNARRALKKRKRIDMFVGSVSDLSPYQYKTHYDLGDTVTLNGDYGKSAKMLVVEYVRTEDVNGDRGYPGLVTP